METWSKDSVLKFGPIIQDIKVNGFKIKLMEMANFYTQMAISTKVNGKMIRLMAMEYINTVMEQNIKDFGRKMSNTDKVFKLGLMAAFMKGNIKMVLDTDLENTLGLMVIAIKETGIWARFKEKALTPGKMAESMLGSGLIIKCTEKVSILGETEGVTVVNIRTTKNKDSDAILGLMGESMRDSGLMVWDMGEENTFWRVVLLNKVFGRETNEWVGKTKIIPKICELLISKFDKLFKIQLSSLDL